MPLIDFPPLPLGSLLSLNVYTGTQRNLDTQRSVYLYYITWFDFIFILILIFIRIFIFILAVALRCCHLQNISQSVACFEPPTDCHWVPAGVRIFPELGCGFSGRLFFLFSGLGAKWVAKKSLFWGSLNLTKKFPFRLIPVWFLNFLTLAILPFPPLGLYFYEFHVNLIA